LGYLNPRPTLDEIARYYPDQYFTPAAPKSRTELEKQAKRFSRRVKQWIMEDFYGYPMVGSRRPWHTFRKALLWPEYLRRLWRGRDIIPWGGAGRLLDVGCGPGGNLAVFQEQGWDVYGIDFTPEAVQQARARVGDRIHAGTLETAPYKDGTFDVIFLSHSFEHFFSPSQALIRLRQLLAPKGRLVITVPNSASLEAGLFGPAWTPWELPRHLYHFSPVTIRHVLEKAGFRVAQLKTSVASHFFMVSLDRAWNKRFHRGLPMYRSIEKWGVSLLCRFTGHLGYGPEIMVHAVKADRER